MDALQALRVRYPAVLRVHSEVDRLPARGAAGEAFEASLDILLPQRQLILNRQGPDAEAALRRAVEAAAAALARLAP